MFEPEHEADEFSVSEQQLQGGPGDGGQQEVAMAATSDNAALNDAVESLLGGRR